MSSSRSFLAVCEAAKRIGYIARPASPHSRHLPSAGFATAGLAVLDDEVTIQKLLRRPTGENQQWLNEARFYAELAPLICDEEIRVPSLKGLRILDQDSVAIQLDYVCGTTITDFETRHRLIRAFGRLAAFTHQKHLHQANWLPRASGIGAIADSQSVRQTREFIHAVGGPNWSPLQAFLEAAPGLRSLHVACTPALCHGDASQQNLLRQTDGIHFCVLDWAKVNSGMVGDDLSRLIYPALLMHGEQLSEKEIAKAESEMFQSYLEGVLSVESDISPESVKIAFQIRSVVLAFGLDKTLAEWLRKTKTVAIRETRMNTVRAFYNFLSERASKLSGEARRHA